MSDNPLLGHVVCPDGNTAEVRQTKKRGRHFYTQCACCGLNQGTGAARQQHIYDNAEFLPGVTIVRPSNVNEVKKPVGEPEKVPELESKTGPGPAPKVAPVVGDFDPSVDIPESEPRPESIGLVRFLPGVALLVAAGVGVWMG